MKVTAQAKAAVCTAASVKWTTVLFAVLLIVASVLPTTHAGKPVDNPDAHKEVRCGFDELEARTIGTRVSGISRVVQPPLAQRSADAATRLAAWQPIRIRVFTEDLQNPSKYCTKAGDVRPDFQGSTATCTKNDVLTDGKKTVLTELLIPSAIQLHEDRLNVQRVSGSIVVDPSISSDSICGQFTIPASHTTTGVSGADFVLYMSAGPTSGSTIAWAITCQYFGDTGRPAVGASNVSPKYISADPQTVRVIAHELLHALGFSVTTFRARGILSTVSLRGKGASPVLASSNVVARTQAQYGCSTQTFMELEDKGGAGTAYSHWKRRSAKDELMAGISGVGHYTALTIAAMEDTGFYKGNYAKAEPMSYGQNAGCGLATSKCVVNGVSQFSGMFCASTGSDMTCTSDRTAIGHCAIATYTSALPSYFQYFADATRGGGDALMDYCPYIQEYSNTNCTIDTDTLLGNAYGVNSRCFDVPTGFISDGYYIASQLAICASVQCDASTSTYGVKVSGASSYTTCTPGARLSLSSLSSSFWSGTLTCPSYDDVCVGQVDAKQYAKYSDALGNTQVSGDGHYSTFLQVPKVAMAVLTLLLLALCA